MKENICNNVKEWLQLFVTETNCPKEPEMIPNSHFTEQMRGEVLISYIELKRANIE